MSAKCGGLNWSTQHSNLLAKIGCGHERRRRVNYSVAQRSEIWDRWQAGEPMSSIGRRFDRDSSLVFSVISPTGGIRPPDRHRAKKALRPSEREEISRWLIMRRSLRSIARHLGRSASSISREVQRNGGADRYRAARSDQAAWDRARRPKLCKLACRPFLRRTVSIKLRRQWSPEQIAGWLKRTYPMDLQKQVSHETIYRSLFIQARGVLKKELLEHLRARRTVRRSRHASMKRSGLGQIKNAVSISERPPSVEDRAIPGHWEGDLIGGSGNSYIATLVERHSRYVMLVKVANKDTESVVSALIKQSHRLPTELYRSLTWDRGKELADHQRLTLATKVEAYFCDPQSPWQRGTNENTNRLLRQYLPRGTDLSLHSQAKLSAIARQLNERPRKTLLYQTPAEKFAECVAAIG
jgi:IS30 family transposase